MRRAAARDGLRPAAQPSPSPRARWRDDDSGDASIQMVIVMPFVILFAVLIAQTAMWYYAREVAQTAAREGVSTGRTYHSSVGAGTSRASRVASDLGSGTLLGPRVSSAGSTADRITITVSGHAPSIIPGMSGISISQSASGPRENWRRP